MRTPTLTAGLTEEGGGMRRQRADRKGSRKHFLKQNLSAYYHLSVKHPDKRQIIPCFHLTLLDSNPQPCQVKGALWDLEYSSSQQLHFAWGKTVSISCLSTSLSKGDFVRAHVFVDFSLFFSSCIRRRKIICQLKSWFCRRWYVNKYQLATFNYC